LPNVRQTSGNRLAWFALFTDSTGFVLVIVVALVGIAHALPALFRVRYLQALLALICLTRRGKLLRGTDGKEQGA